MSLDRWLAVIGVVLAVIFGVISFIQTNKANKKKRPKYVIDTEKIITPSEEKYKDLDIHYKGEKVNRFSVSKIAFWNEGSLSIRREDIPSTQSLKIENKGTGTFFDTSLIFNSNYSNNFKVTMLPNKKEALLDFDYFDKNRGVVIQVLHCEEDAGNIVISGDIIDCESIERGERPYPPMPKRLGILMKCFLGFLFSAAFGITIVYSIPNLYHRIDQSFTPENLLSRIIIVAFYWLVFIFWFVYYYIKMIKHRNIPDTLKKNLWGTELDNQKIN